MKKTSVSASILSVLCILFLLSGCVSTEQITSLQEEIDTLQSALDTVTSENANLKNRTEEMVDREEFTSTVATLVPLSRFNQQLGTRDELINGLSDELQQRSQELETLLEACASSTDLNLISKRIDTIENEFNDVSSVLSQMMAYGGYDSSQEILNFVYGLVDIYDNLTEVERKLNKLKEAMLIFVED